MGLTIILIIKNILLKHNSIAVMQNYLFNYIMNYKSFQLF